MINDKDYEVEYSKKTQDDIKNGNIVKRTINGQDYYFPKLVNRPTLKKAFSCNCIYCGHDRFRFRSSVFGKNYYQCENCWGVNC